jgi:hypothetical protein
VSLDLVSCYVEEHPRKKGIKSWFRVAVSLLLPGDRTEWRKVLCRPGCLIGKQILTKISP